MLPPNPNFLFAFLRTPRILVGTGNQILLRSLGCLYISYSVRTFIPINRDVWMAFKIIFLLMNLLFLFGIFLLKKYINFLDSNNV